MIGRLLGAVLLCTALTACDSSLSGQSGKGFVAGDGALTIVPKADRKAPRNIEGTTLTGDRISLDDFKGKLVVMPVWGSWCGPCRAEAPMLQKAADDLAAQNVAFLGINVRDYDAAERDAFVRNVGMKYPSISNNDSSLLLNFQSGLSPKTVPSVAFIDTDGKVAATGFGAITAKTLYGVVEDLQK